MNRLRGVGLLLPVLTGCSGVESPMTTFAPKSDFAGRCQLVHADAAIRLMADGVFRP